jgi:hypothetical protein
MQGYRTYAVAVAWIIAWAIAKFGLAVDKELLADAVVAVAATMIGMRRITTTPPGEKP